MINFSKRLKAATHEIGLKTARALAQKSGVSERNVGKYMRGEVYPDSKTLYKISKALNVPMEYLLTGEYPAPHMVDVENLPFSVSPVKGEVGAGPAIQNCWREQEMVIIHNAVKQCYGPGEYFAVWARGQSMEPLIKSGSLVLCRAEQLDPALAKWRYVYCVNLPDDDGAVLKKVRYDKTSGRVILVSINPTMAPVALKPSSARIVGRAVGVVWQGV